MYSYWCSSDIFRAPSILWSAQQTQLNVFHRGTNTPVVSVTGLNVVAYSPLVVKVTVAISSCSLGCFLALYMRFGKGCVLRGYLGAVFGCTCSFVPLIVASSLDLLQLCVCVFVLHGLILELTCCFVFSDQLLVIKIIFNSKEKMCWTMQLAPAFNVMFQERKSICVHFDKDRKKQTSSQ